MRDACEMLLDGQRRGRGLDEDEHLLPDISHSSVASTSQGRPAVPDC